MPDPRNLQMAEAADTHGNDLCRCITLLNEGIDSA